MQPSSVMRAIPHQQRAPEAAFGTEALHVEGATAKSSMRPGPWAQQDGQPWLHPGCVGVLTDDVSAQAVLTARTPGQWAVSSAISIDFHAPIPAATPRVHATATLTHRSTGWGHSSGQLTTEAGDLVATIGQRMRYFPAPPQPATELPDPAPAPVVAPEPWLRSLDTLLSLSSSAGAVTEFAVAAVPGMLNPLGIIHGGVSLCLSEVAARLAWAGSPLTTGEDFHTSSLRIAYLRPGRADGQLSLRVRVQHASRSVVLAEVELRNADGTVATHATSTLHRTATLL